VVYTTNNNNTTTIERNKAKQKQHKIRCYKPNIMW